MRCEDSMPETEFKFLTPTEAKDFIDALPNGSFFSVVFMKADGTLRRMVCKTGVTAHLKGGEATYQGKDGKSGNIGVYDTEAKGYRCFNQARIVRIKGNGKLKGPEGIDQAVYNANGEVVSI